MDVAGSLSVTHSCRARVAEVRMIGRRSVARIVWTLGDSNLSRLTTLKFCESFGGELIESALCGIALDLPIPRLPVVLHEPITECSQFLGSKLFDFALKSFNFGHVIRSLRYPPQIPHVRIAKRPHARRFGVEPWE